MTEPLSRRELLAASAATALAFGNVRVVDAAGAPTDGNAAATVLYNDQAVSLKSASLVREDLWIAAADLPRINGFEVKPQGACNGATCILLPKGLVSGGRISVTGLARRLGQAFVIEPAASVVSFGEIPAVRGAFYKSRLAPDIAVPDRAGKVARLSAFRGKKVLVFTWASWCLCKNDLKGWETVYTELKDRNFEIVAAAQDTGGEAAAGKWYDVAKATYTCLIDANHTVSTAFQFVNVPMGVWIDERGRVVRPAEPAWTTDTSLKLGGKSVATQGTAYVSALRDWVAKGSRSRYALSDAEFAKRVKPRSTAEMEADASFKLASYLRLNGKDELAADWYKRAQDLAPDDWNYFRQQWSYKPMSANMNWLKKLMASDKPYYAPLELPNQSP